MPDQLSSFWTHPFLPSLVLCCCSSFVLFLHKQFTHLSTRPSGAVASWPVVPSWFFLAGCCHGPCHRFCQICPTSPFSLWFLLCLSLGSFLLSSSLAAGDAAYLRWGECNRYSSFRPYYLCYSLLFYYNKELSATLSSVELLTSRTKAVLQGI